MIEIHESDIEDIALGASLLGSGGGGDPYIGKLMAIQAIREFGPVTLLSPDEIPGTATVAASGMMGAPTVLNEKIPSGEEVFEVFDVLSKYLGRPIDATYPIEAGGVNSLLPIALAARLKIPVIDADGMGRAFPELQMVTFTIDGILPTPMVLGDEKGNIGLLKTVTGKWTERLARAMTIEQGGAVQIAIFPMSAEQLKQSGVPNRLRLERDIGRAIRTAKEDKVSGVEAMLRITGGRMLFRGKLADIDRRTEGGFSKGTAVIQGMHDYRDGLCKVHFQNENLVAFVDDEPVCMTPDLISIIDSETGIPITTESLRYGSRVIVVGIPCHEKWRTPAGLELVGPRYFGYDLDFTPVENLVTEASSLVSNRN